MKLNIIIPYRPLSHGASNTPLGELYQLPDGRWGQKNDRHEEYQISGIHRYDKTDELIRAIEFINKNSYYKHNIIIGVDNDVYPNEDYFKKFDNVRIFKARYVYNGDLKVIYFYRQNAVHKETIDSIPDDEWICYSFIADLICSKHWDKPIDDAIQQYGDNFVYVPMFAEVRGGMGNKIVRESEISPGNIWDTWRRDICCHALTMPIPDKGYFIEEDMDNYIKVANAANKGIITEKPGDRIYGYYATMIMKARYGKRAMRLIGPGFDTDFDNRLYSECNLLKKVITNSIVFHPFCEFKEQ